MIIRNKIFEEIKQSEAYILGLQKYTDKMRKRNRIFQSLLACSSCIGTLGAFISLYIPAATSILATMGVIGKQIIPNLLQDEKELSELDRLMNFYTNYLTTLEIIWYEFENEKIDDDEAAHRFLHLKETEGDKPSTYNKLVYHISSKMQTEIDIESQIYVDRIYYSKYD